MKNKQKYSSDDLNFALSAAFLDVDLRIANLPLNKRPSWEKRARTKTKELLLDARIKKLINNYRNSSDRHKLHYFIASLKIEYGLPSSVISLLVRSAETGSVDSVGYLGGIFLVVPEAKGVYPCDNPRQEYEELGLNQKFTYTHLAILGDDTSKMDFIDFNKYYMSKYFEVLQNLGAVKSNKTKALNLPNYSKCLELRESGLTQLQIANELGIDVSLVNKYLNRIKRTSIFANNPLG